MKLPDTAFLFFQASMVPVFDGAFPSFLHGFDTSVSIVQNIISKGGFAENIPAVLQACSADVAAYDERLAALQTELLNKAKSKEEYDDLIQEIYKVEAKSKRL